VVLSVPISVSALRIARQAIGIYMSNDRSRIEYVLKGKISGPTFSARAVRVEGRDDTARRGGGDQPVTRRVADDATLLTPSPQSPLLT
jgi:hypothetical protein